MEISLLHIVQLDVVSSLLDLFWVETEMKLRSGLCFAKSLLYVWDSQMKKTSSFVLVGNVAYGP